MRGQFPEGRKQSLLLGSQVMEVNTVLRELEACAAFLEKYKENRILSGTLHAVTRKSTARRCQG